jgi:2-methylcitrate dehydratase PrpD
VRAVLDPEVAKDEAMIRVRTVNGGEFEHHVAHATGSAASPMTDEQLREKARLAVGGVLGARASEFVEVAFGTAELESVEALFEASRP